MSRLTEIDWAEIILDLRRSGMGQNEISRATVRAASEAMVRQYLAGSSPAHWRGEILLDLWSERTGKAREQAPRRIAELPRITERRPRRYAFVAAPHEHLTALEYAYRMSANEITQMLARKGRARQQGQQRGETLPLPGFDV